MRTQSAAAANGRATDLATLPSKLLLVERYRESTYSFSLKILYPIVKFIEIRYSRGRRYVILKKYYVRYSAGFMP
jgi:hypothetical protein